MADPDIPYVPDETDPTLPIVFGVVVGAGAVVVIPMVGLVGVLGVCAVGSVPSCRLGVLFCRNQMERKDYSVFSNLELLERDIAKKVTGCCGEKVGDTVYKIGLHDRVEFIDKNCITPLEKSFKSLVCGVSGMFCCRCCGNSDEGAGTRYSKEDSEEDATTDPIEQKEKGWFSRAYDSISSCFGC